MNRKYFKLWFRLDNIDSYLIWFDDESDGFVSDSRGKVPCFLHTEDLLRYASSENLSVETIEPILRDLDLVASWLGASETEVVDCKILLDAWNIFDDVSRSVGGNFDANPKLTNKIYDKLFWGNNLPSVTPKGKSYEPIWAKRELKIIRETLSAGLSLFREKISYL